MFIGSLVVSSRRGYQMTRFFDSMTLCSTITICCRSISRSSFVNVNSDSNINRSNSESIPVVAIGLSANESDDVKQLLADYSPVQLAKAARTREVLLRKAAALVSSSSFSSSSSGGELKELHHLLLAHLDSANCSSSSSSNNSGLAGSLEDSSNGHNKYNSMDLSYVDFTKSATFTAKELLIIKNILLKIPRQKSDNPLAKPERRASVLIPLCNDNGVASILFECRSDTVRTHKKQVCFPGGMFDDEYDKSIVQTGLREMQEELGIPIKNTEVLGVLRCNWHEVSDFTGIAITPVIGYVGEINDIRFNVNRDEVSDYFTVKVTDLLDEKKWVRRNFSAPIFTGAQPHVIWGLTAYLLDRFIDGVLKSNDGKDRKDGKDGEKYGKLNGSK